MDKIIEFSALIYQKISIAKKWIVALAIILLLLFTFGVRSCSGPLGSHMYKIARDPTWFPLRLLGKEKNLTVFSNDLLAAIANEEKIGIRIFDVNAMDLFARLDSSEYDAVLSSLLPNALNSEKYFFSEPLLRTGPVLIVPVHSDAKSLDDLKDKLIGFYSNSTLFLKTAYDTSIHIVPYYSTAIILDDLDKGRIDAAIIDAVPAHIYVRGFYNSRLKIVTEPLTSEGIRLITRNEMRYNSLINKFNAGLTKIREDGTYQALIDKWSLINF